MQLHDRRRFMKNAAGAVLASSAIPAAISAGESNAESSQAEDLLGDQKPRIVIAADPFAVQLKDAIVEHLVKLDYGVADVGATDDKPVDHTESAPVACRGIQEGRFDRGILLCGTGMGMSIIANKFSGIVASCVESVEAAKLCRALNNANVLCLGQMLWGEWNAIEAVNGFLSTNLAEHGFEEISELLHRFAREIDEIDRDNRRIRTF